MFRTLTTRSFLIALASVCSLSAAHATSVYVYDASVSLLMPFKGFRGARVLVDGQPTPEVKKASKILKRNLLSADAREVHENFGIVLDFYKNRFGRMSFDGKDTAVYASVNVNRQMFKLDLMGLRENAAWLGLYQNLFIFGHGGDGIANFTGALDVVGHEFTHAVIESTSNLDYIGQSGALNEHLADVFGVLIRHAHRPNYPDPFLIGDEVMIGEARAKAPALRDMQDPHRGAVKQPKHMSELMEGEFKKFGPDCDPRTGEDNCGVHILSGIPNHVAYLIIEAIGWEKSEKLFYSVMTQRLQSDSKFEDYKREMIAECELTMPSLCASVREAFEKVGL